MQWRTDIRDPFRDDGGWHILFCKKCSAGYVMSGYVYMIASKKGGTLYVATCL